ncbi:hypothetical protein ACFVZX_17345, partial [Streptomyces erythrochromogenes]
PRWGRPRGRPRAPSRPDPHTGGRPPGGAGEVYAPPRGAGPRRLYADLFRELLADLAEVRLPPPFAPPAHPPTVDMTPLLGTYRREGVVITVGVAPDGTPQLRYEFADGMRDFSPPLEMDLVPLSATVFAAAGAGPSFSEDWMPVVFAALVDGTPCCYIGMRCAPRTTAD